MSPISPRSTRELLQALVDTPLGAELREPTRHRERVYRELAESDDPLLREIGVQLRDGLIRPHQLLGVPGYDAVIDERLALVQQMDPAEIRQVWSDYVDSVRGRGAER